MSNYVRATQKFVPKWKSNFPQNDRLLTFTLYSPSHSFSVSCFHAMWSLSFTHISSYLHFSQLSTFLNYLHVERFSVSRMRNFFCFFYKEDHSQSEQICLFTKLLLRQIQYRFQRNIVSPGRRTHLCLAKSSTVISQVSSLLHQGSARWGFCTRFLYLS